MHKYRMITYRCGAVVEIVKCYALRQRKGQERDPNVKKKTREEIQEANRRQAAKNLERLINANFRPGDLHTTLTYTREMRPDKQTAQNTPSPVTTYALFRDGKFVTHAIQSDKKFLALAGI